MLRSKQLDLKKLLKNFDKKGLAPKIKKDYDMFLFITQHKRIEFTELDWMRMLSIDTTTERIDYWFQLGRMERKNHTIQKAENLFYQTSNSWNNTNNNIEQPTECTVTNKSVIDLSKQIELSSRAFSLPKLALDLHYMKGMSKPQMLRMLLETKEFLQDNYSIPRLSFPIEFINYDEKELEMNNFLTEVSYTWQNALFPPVFKNKHNYKGNNTVYISSKSNNVFKGPLCYDEIVIPLTHDSHFGTLGSAKKMRVNDISFPFKRYFKLEQGSRVSFHLPAMRSVFEDVFFTGDWRYSMKKHYPPHLLLPPRERSKLPKTEMQKEIKNDFKLRKELLGILE